MTEALKAKDEPADRLTQPEEEPPKERLLKDNIDLAPYGFSVKNILAKYPNRAAWEEYKEDSLKFVVDERKALIAQILYLNALRNTKAPIVEKRAERVRGNDSEAGFAKNLEQWINFCRRVPAMTDDALKRANWLQLLEDEYRKIEPEWVKFWDYQEAAEEQLFSAGYEYRDKKHDFGTLLGDHVKKRTFLQFQIIESDCIHEEIYAKELPWVKIDMRFMTTIYDDGTVALRRVFFAKGNPFFIDFGKTLKEVMDEMKELGIEMDSDLSDYSMESDSSDDDTVDDDNAVDGDDAADDKNAADGADHVVDDPDSSDGHAVDGNGK